MGVGHKLTVPTMRMYGYQAFVGKYWLNGAEEGAMRCAAPRPGEQAWWGTRKSEDVQRRQSYELRTGDSGRKVHFGVGRSVRTPTTSAWPAPRNSCEGARRDLGAGERTRGYGTRHGERTYDGLNGLDGYGRNDTVVESTPR
jgi:hypothetical protein